MTRSAAAAFLTTLLLLPAAARSDPASAPGTPAPRPPSSSVTLLGPLSSAGSSSAESSYGDLVADAVRAAAPDADVALVPADDLVDISLGSGTTAIADVVKGLRYGGDSSETIVVLPLSGKQLRDLAARSVRRAPEPFPGFLQVSNLAIVYAPGAAGPRVGPLTVAGLPVRDDKTYRAATTRSVADGSFGYFRILDGVAGVDTGLGIDQALVRYLQAHPAVQPAGPARIAAR